jgi:hypothetical protein
VRLPTARRIAFGGASTNNAPGSRSIPPPRQRSRAKLHLSNRTTHQAWPGVQVVTSLYRSRTTPTGDAQPGVVRGRQSKKGSGSLANAPHPTRNKRSPAWRFCDRILVRCSLALPERAAVAGSGLSLVVRARCARSRDLLPCHCHADLGFAVGDQFTAEVDGDGVEQSARTAPASHSRASCPNAATTSSKNSATTRSRPSSEPCHAASPRSTDEPRPAPGETAADPPTTRGRPRKTERPHHHLPEHPIQHHVADPKPSRAECQSKPGRPRTHTSPSTRPRTSRSINGPHQRTSIKQ